MDLTIASKNRFMQLNELAELRDGAYENTKIYKERTKKWHDSRLRRDKDFKVGDKVLLYNYHLKMYLGKLKSKWYGLNIVTAVYLYGVVEITDKNGFSFKVNGERLKQYYEGNIDREDEEVVEFVTSTTFQYSVSTTMDTAYRLSLDKGANVKSIQNILIERNLIEIFPEDLLELPPTRIVEFWIDLVQEAEPVAKAPYRLAPSELQELSRKL
ncbi:hypothetical protein Tco_0614908 [Tanacetum coccineum]